MPPHHLFPWQSLQRADRQIGGNAAPETVKRPDRARRAIFDQALHDHGTIDRPGRGAGKPIELDALIFQQAFHGAPGEGAMRTATLQGQAEPLFCHRLGDSR